MTKTEPIRILYMENDVGLARLVQKELERVGYVVDIACDGEEGLTMYDAGSYDVVLVDKSMPVRDGLEVIRMMASRGQLPPTIMITGVGDELSAVESMKQGAVDYIVKDAEGGYLKLLPSVIQRALHQQQAEKALKESEEKWRSLVENAPNIIVIAARDGTIQSVNHTLSGISVEEIVGKKVYDYAVPEHHSVIRETIERAFQAGETGHYKVKAVDTHGRYSWQDTQVGAIKQDGQVVTVTLTATDITEKKQAEEQVRYQAHLLENVSDAVISTDMNFVIQSWNKAAESMYGYEAHEVLGKPLGELVKPEYPDDTREGVIQKFIENGYYEGEVTHHRKDGTPITIWGSVSMLKDSDGNPVSAVSVNRNITERKRAEEALREANLRLEKTLAELQTTQQQIIQQERLRALGQMASGVAHDFNNALTPILGYCQLIFMVPATLDDKEKTMGYLKLMNIAAKDASSIVTRLREFYRERAEDEIFSPVDLNPLVKQTIQLTEAKWKDQAQSDGITINVRTDLQKVPFINGNSSELRNTLTNLIFNAVDAMKRSFASPLRSEQENGTITIRTHLDNDFVVLEVSDTGIGMTDEVQQRCFEPFFSTKDESGTGLGLAMVHGIIRRHEGTIDVLSKPGEGTTFIIRLPISVEERAESEGRAAETTTRSMRVLLVDDKPMVRDVITKYLTTDGHTVQTANNGREGLETFYKGRFDLVITDKAMPDMNGIQLAILIKQIAPNKPIIMLTGFGDMMKMTGDVPAEIDCLLSKPVTLNDFREALAKVIAEA